MELLDLTYMTVLVQKSHDWLPLSTDYDEVCEMLQSLGQNTCTMNGNDAVALHCGQSLGGHSLLYQDAGQTVSSKGIPTPYTKKITQTKIKKEEIKRCILQNWSLML